MSSRPVRSAAALIIVTCLGTAAHGQIDLLKRWTSPSADPPKKTKAVAYFEITGELVETPVAMPPLFGSEPPKSLKGLLQGLKEARLDNDVVAVALDLQNAHLGAAQIEEIHAALRRFAAVEKEVFVHADMLSTMTYATATGASHISMVPTGDLYLLGLYSETPYVRGALDKLGCVPDFEHCGDFKTGADFITRTGPSPQQEEMTNWLLDGLYAGVVNQIATGRSMTPEKVRSLIDGGPYGAEDALAAGLIDSVQHRQAFVNDLRNRYGKDVEFVRDYGQEDMFELPDDNFFAMIEQLMKMFNPSPKVYTEPSVAIVYVEGAIMLGEGEESPLSPASGAFSTSVRRALDRAADDDSVKAVVLRVDSPGGSALASEIMLNATRRVAERKPLIVSMGNVAASGGYYVTCAAEMVFADANTITASIGVLGGKVVTTAMWNNWGINWHAKKRGAMSGMMSSAAPFSDAERSRIRDYMNRIYDVFKGHVVAARKGKLTKPIDTIAGGRVFTGAQALDLGLVDKIGGLEDAIAFAAKRAGLVEYDVRVIPEPPTIFDLFAPHAVDDEFLGAEGRGRLNLARTEPFAAELRLMFRLDPLRVRAILAALRLVEIVNAEGVAAMMPISFVVR